MQIFEKYWVPIISFLLFLLIGFAVWMFRDIRYFYLFAGIGIAELITRTVIIHFPKLRQFFRLFTQALIGGFLFCWLSLFIGINFQFPQIFFDASAGIVTGTLIQMLIARVLLPFFLGNAFCSRACWTGFFFEMTNSKKHLSKKTKKRSELLAWGYLLALIILPLFVSIYHNPAEDEESRKLWIVGENIFIISFGFILLFLTGSRSYCRMLCPFITISGLFSRFSFFKITPLNHENCTQCNSCNEACQMLIDVKGKVLQKQKISHKLCIVCERCVSACQKDVLKLTNKKIEK